MECGLIGLIKLTYPISFISLVGATFGALLAYLPYAKRIRCLEKQLGIRMVKEQK